MSGVWFNFANIMGKTVVNTWVPIRKCWWSKQESGVKSRLLLS